MILEQWPATGDGRIPFLVLTGFLGSGKTTLLNRLLREDIKWLVLMNEFGKEPLDQHLMDGRGIPLALLSGGCVCCTVRGALAPMLRNLHMGRSATGFAAVVMETSGVADPGPVLDTLLKDRWLAARYRLVAIIATLDAQQGLEHIERFPEAARQAALADRVLITKADLATPEAVASLRQRLALINPAAEVMVAGRGGWDARILLHSAPFNRTGFVRSHAPPLVGTGFESAAQVFNQALRGDVEGVLARLLGELGPALLRVKGILDVEGETQPLVVHGVEGRLYPRVRLSAWPEGDRRSRLVAIGAGPDREPVERFLREFAQAVGH